MIDQDIRHFLYSSQTTLFAGHYITLFIKNNMEKTNNDWLIANLSVLRDVQLFCKYNSTIYTISQKNLRTDNHAHKQGQPHETVTCSVLFTTNVGVYIGRTKWPNTYVMNAICHLF